MTGFTIEKIGDIDRVLEESENLKIEYDAIGLEYEDSVLIGKFHCIVRFIIYDTRKKTGDI